MEGLTCNVSKAFTREDDLVPDEITQPRAQVSPGSANYITRTGADRLREQMAGLLEQKRLSMSRADEPDAKASLRRTEAEIARLQQTLNSVTVADPPADQEKIAFGAFVTVRDSAGEDETYQIVGVDEAEPAEGRISASSPLGQALLNRRAGEKVHFQVPAGDQELTILEVRY